MLRRLCRPPSTLCAHVLRTLGKRLEPACYARELCGLTRRSGEGHECLGRNHLRGKETILRVVRDEAARLTELAGRPGAWGAPTVRGDQEIADRYLNRFFRI